MCCKPSDACVFLNVRRLMAHALYSKEAEWHYSMLCKTHVLIAAVLRSTAIRVLGVMQLKHEQGEKEQTGRYSKFCATYVYYLPLYNCLQSPASLRTIKLSSLAVKANERNSVQFELS